MRPALLKDHTRILGRGQGFVGLPIRDEVQDCNVGGEVRCMVSEHELSIDEIQLLIEGGRIRLSVQGTAHPPILLTVTDPAEDLIP